MIEKAEICSINTFHTNHMKSEKQSRFHIKFFPTGGFHYDS